MGALAVIERLLGFAIFIFILFQLLIPMLTGTPLFPAFRLKKKAVDALIEAEEELHIAKIEKTAAQLHAEAEAIRNPKEDSDGFTQPDAGPPQPAPHEDLPRSG